MSETIVYFSFRADKSPAQLIFPTDPNDGLQVMKTSPTAEAHVIPLCVVHQAVSPTPFMDAQM